MTANGFGSLTQLLFGNERVLAAFFYFSYFCDAARIPCVLYILYMQIYYRIYLLHITGDRVVAGRPVTVGQWFPPGTLVSSTRKLISSSSFHRLDMTLAVAEALNPNKPKTCKES